MSSERKNQPHVSLLGMEHAFGNKVVQNRQIEEKYGKPEGTLITKTGKEKGHEWENGTESAVDASLRCLDSILDDVGLDKSQIGAVFGTTNPVSVDRKLVCESLTQVFADRAGFGEDTKISDESFGCGGSAVGIESMYRWLQTQPKGTYALYVTQDCPRGMVEDWNTEALFSDAVSVSLWTINDTDDGIAKIEAVFASGSNIDDDTLGIDEDGVWRMYGKGVVEDASQVPRIVAEELGIDLKDYDIVPHQPNAKLLETMEQMYGVSFFKDVAKTHGNPTCSGALIALERKLKNEDTDSDTTKKDILVMPFGAGGFGGFILKRK